MRRGWQVATRFADIRRLQPAGGSARRKGLRHLLACAIAFGALTASGCGSGSTGTVPVSSPLLTEEQHRILVGVFDLMEEVGMAQWADYGRSFLTAGRIHPIDFSSRDANPWGLTGYDAIANLSDGNIYLDKTTWTGMPPRMLVIVMLDELCHFRFQTSGHADYERLRDQFEAAWCERYGGPFSRIREGDEPYLEWFRKFSPYRYQEWLAAQAAANS